MQSKALRNRLGITTDIEAEYFARFISEPIIPIFAYDDIEDFEGIDFEQVDKQVTPLINEIYVMKEFHKLKNFSQRTDFAQNYINEKFSNDNTMKEWLPAAIIARRAWDKFTSEWLPTRIQEMIKDGEKDSYIAAKLNCSAGRVKRERVALDSEAPN